MPVITYTLDAETSDFDSGMAGAQSGMKNAGLAAGKLAAGVLAAGAALNALVAQTVAVVDEVNTLAGASGLSASTINGLRLAAEASGKALTDLVPRDLSSRIQKAAGESKKLTKAYADLGVEVIDANGGLRDANAVYTDLVKKITAIDDPTQRAAAATATLGTAGQELISAFGGVEDFEKFVALGDEFGIKTGPEAAAAAGKWQVATANLGLAFETAGQRFLDAFGGAGAIAGFIDSVALGFVFLTEFVARFAEETFERFQQLGKGLQKLFAGDVAGAIAEVEKAKDPLDTLGDAFDDAFNKAQKFWELQQLGPKEGAEALGTYNPIVDKTTKAVDGLAKATEDAAKATSNLGKITAETASDTLTARDKVEIAFLKRLDSINKEVARLEELGAIGVDVAAALAEAEAAKFEVSARAQRDLTAVVQAEQRIRLDAFEAARQEELTKRQESWDLQVLQAEELTAILEQEAQNRKEANFVALDAIAEAASLVSTLLINNAKAEAEVIQEKIDQELALVEAIKAEGGQQSAISKEKIKGLKKELRETAKQAKAGFALGQTAAVAAIAIDAAKSVLALIPFFSFLGPGAPAAAGGVVVPVAALQTAVVLQQKAPELHDGVANVDEVLATLRGGESVLNQRATQSIGGERIDRANRGEPLGPQGVTQIVFQGRVLDQMISETIEAGGRTQRILGRDRPPAGTLDPFGGA